MYRTFIDKLYSWKENRHRKPLVLKGARQVGKTYILKQFGHSVFPRFHYVNFETDEKLVRIFDRDLKPHRILEDLCFYLDSGIDVDRDLIIFDEIQECPRALTSLKYFSEDLPQLAICTAGSLLGIELGNVSFPVGKVEFEQLCPLSFEEFLIALDDNKSVDVLRKLEKKKGLSDIIHSHLWDQFKRYLIIGGLPEVIQTYVEYKNDLYTALNKVRDKHNQLILAYLADMAKHSGKQNAMHLERLWRNISAQLSREHDGAAAKFKFKGVLPGIHTYSRLSSTIDWLAAAGLIIKCPIVSKGLLPLSAYTRENFFKLYYFDVGILGAISKLPPKTILDYDYGSYKGYYAENVIAQQFQYAGFDEIYSWRENTAEVEFLRIVEDNIIPIEVKSGWITQAKSLKVFARKYQPPYRAIFSARNLAIDDESGVHRYPMYLAYRFPL